MDQIEVIIKLQTKNLMNYMLIGRSDKIEKLKELCEKISDVPPDKQILIYKGRILSNDKLISDYNINDGDNIILKKKEDPSPVNNPLIPNSCNLNLNNDFTKNNIISLTNNKEINFNEVANMYKQSPDYLSTLLKMDINKLNNLSQSLGFESFSDFSGIDSQNLNLILNETKDMDIMNNIIKDPSLLEIVFNHPKIKKIIQNNPFIKFGFQNPQIFLSPQNHQMSLNMNKKDEKNKIESSSTGISVPPDPFENNQMLNSSGKK